MAARVFEDTKTHWIVHFSKENGMLFELYIKKKKTLRDVVENPWCLVFRVFQEL